MAHSNLEHLNKNVRVYLPHKAGVNMRTSFAAVGLFILSFWASSGARAEEFGWAGAIGGNQLVTPYSVVTDSAGFVYVAGSFIGSADFDPGPGSVVLSSAGSYDGFVVKLDSAGRLVWARSVGGSSYDQARGVAVDSGGNVWVVGSFQGTVDFDPGPGVFPLAGNGTDAFIWKRSAAGDLLWAGRVGGASTDMARSVAIGGFGVVYVVGTFIQTADFDPGPGVFNLTSAGNEDVFVLKLDGGGGFLWARRMGGPSPDEPFGMTLAGDERVWTVGRFGGTADFDPGSGTYELTASGLYDGFVSELDRSGNFVWAGSIGGTGIDRFDGIAPGGSSAVYAVGTFQGTADLDPGPKTDERTSAGGYDLFVMAMGDGGALRWTSILGGALDDYAAGVVTDGDGDVWTVGQFQDTVDFDPGAGTFPLTASWYDAFAWKLDEAGSFRWAGQFGGIGDDGAGAIAPGTGGGVCIVGDFSSAADFDPGPGTFYLSPAGTYDAFVARLDRCGAFTDRSLYGRLVFKRRCTEDASGLPGAPGTPYVYESAVVRFHRNPADTLFLSSDGNDFAPIAVDDELHIDGLDSGLGPFGLQPGVPPFLFDVPIERNVVPEPPLDVTGLLPLGTSSVLFETVDLDRAVVGHTPVYLVIDCGLIVDGRGPTAFRFVSHDDTVLGLPIDFDVRGGALSDLRSDRGFARAACLGRFSSNPAQDPLPDPPPGDGWYYLARSLATANACSARGYGEAHGLDPDPRETLDSTAACP